MIFLLRRCHLQPKLSAAVGLRVAAPRPPPSFSRGFHLSVLWISPNHPEDQVKNLCVRQRASAFLMSQPRGRGSRAATAATAARLASVNHVAMAVLLSALAKGSRPALGH